MARQRGPNMMPMYWQRGEDGLGLPMGPNTVMRRDWQAGQRGGNFGLPNPINPARTINDGVNLSGTAQGVGPRSEGASLPVYNTTYRPNGTNYNMPTRPPIQGLAGQLAQQQQQFGPGGAPGGFGGGGGDVNYWINRQFQENAANRQQTLNAINEQNRLLGVAGGALARDPLQIRARQAAMSNFAGSGPEALNQASSRVNAAANLQGLQNRFLAGEQGQVGGSGLSAMNAMTENQRIAGLGQVASEAAQRRFAEQQAAIGQANQLATGQAQFGLQAVDMRALPNFQPQDFSGIGSLLAQQQMAGALGAGLGAIGAGIGALGQQQQNQYAAPNIMGNQLQNVPGLDATGNPGLASAIGLALASGRQPLALSNNDPRLAQALGQVNSRWGGAVNAQDSLGAQAMQAQRGFGPGEMEATQRFSNPWTESPGFATTALYGTGRDNPLNALNRQPMAFQRSAGSDEAQGGKSGPGRVSMSSKVRGWLGMA